MPVTTTAAPPPALSCPPTSLGRAVTPLNSPPERVLDLLWLCPPGTGDSTGTAAQCVGGVEGERETHSQSACWTYCGSACLGQEIALGQRHSGFGFGPRGGGKWGGGGRERQRETHHQSARWIYCASTFLEQKIGLEQQHSVGCYCCCYLGGTGEDEKLADLLWLWLSETSECVQCAGYLIWGGGGDT